ncbi:hypothetical protein GCM10010992_14400 [Cloacibacterium rupense]|uniref:Lipopolysaccharide assembly protein A domain-containing protein n=1 Tax=Cloacibacterium rupense TaxID=517423 RepID=A0ABQ2NI63_9FLAO|nr:hypothetical protein [Cloacibacterium rupense]GGP03966.1 hypothetical protein GCM10010992_14400 [Cloacibacterium rupense]
MKSISTIGILLLLLSVLLFYLTTDFDVEQLKLSHLMGILGGIGLGLIIGGIVGYVSKGSSVKAEQKRKEFLQLQNEKLELEKQAAELAQQQTKGNSTTTTDNSF